MYVLESQCLATVVCRSFGVKNLAFRLGGVMAQGNVSPAAQDVALSTWAPLYHDHTHTFQIYI